ncbi:hypothetical protein D3C78_46820 [compost metagenome]
MIDELIEIEKEIIKYSRKLDIYREEIFSQNNSNLYLAEIDQISKELELFMQNIHKVINNIEDYNFNKNQKTIYEFDIEESIYFCRFMLSKIRDIFIEHDHIFNFSDNTRYYTNLVNFLKKIKSTRQEFLRFYRKSLEGFNSNKELDKKIKNNIEKVIFENYRNDFSILKKQIQDLTEEKIGTFNDSFKIIKDNFDKSSGEKFKYYKERIEGLILFHENENKNMREKLIKDHSDNILNFNKFMEGLLSERENLIDKFNQSFNDIQKGWEKIQQIKTENVYLNAYKKNIVRSKFNEKKFINVLYLSLLISVGLIFSFIFKLIDFQVFITLKIMVLIFFGILVTYYLRLSSHYRHLADQAEQTHLELLAFPQYVASLNPEKTNEIKEQLALKYFGKNLDTTGYQKMGEVVQEQLKTSVELVKAAASISNGNKSSSNSESTTTTADPVNKNQVREG